MMDRDFNIDLVQQVGNTPAFNIKDIMIWRSCEAEVDKMPQAFCYREDELFKVCEKAWKDPHRVRDAQGLRARVHCDWWGH
jgi:hypothetical protein